MKARCECPNKGTLFNDLLPLYDPKTELPFVEHKPNECKCTNGLKRYNRDGKILWLCSCCVLGGTDRLIEGEE